ncbi:Pimeloyl-ACP methyl ester carboxylesterase [Streptomyces sp. DvalAA-14]|uniref:alpha/beta fold hydrolase n=1 Tax=unclassified Streptomyces TaxID=2593676 RepID=UPI00081B1F6A|nr:MULTISPECIES: alpha/beta hydrolase [unclassified Streptomyces]MYS21910.1 alpha/beta fold hydrolase [Streptomyces sp. SID4948]SCE04073.1 Pimeloyl-ACP methyl ester carboxylesterase [Streptomyces sp. DvalAA-14]
MTPLTSASLTSASLTSASPAAVPSTVPPAVPPAVPPGGLSVVVPAPAPADADDPYPAVVRAHSWQGYHCESRLVRIPAPRLAPLLMIGGAFQRKETWGRFERAFLAHMDVLTVDPPGWGASDVLPDHHGVALLADAVCHMMDERGIERVNLLGGSYGTAIAYRIAQRYPERVARMVLVGTMTSIPGHARAAILRTLELLAERRMAEYAESAVDILMNRDRLGSVAAGAKVRRFLLRRLTQLPEAEAEQTYANTRRLLSQEMIDTSCPPAAPTLVATGEYDSFTTPELCREMAAACRESWFAEVLGADHMLFLERTTELADLATRFFADESLTGLPYCGRVERIRSDRQPSRAG